MKAMRLLGFLFLCGVVVMAGSQGTASARSFKQKIADMSASDTAIDVFGTVVQPESIPDYFGPAVERLAIRGTDFPITSTVPGFSYVYNPSLQVLERSQQLGPVFSERAETVGHGRIELGMSFLWARLDKVDGRGFGTTQALTDVGANVNGVDGIIGQQMNIKDFDLQHFWLNTYATYGINERWDVNLLVPLVYSQLQTHADRTFVFLGPGFQNLGSTSAQARSAHGDHFGVGDVLLRTKYRLLEEGPVRIAGAFTLRTPTGDEDNFQGLGDWALTPSAIFSAPLPFGVGHSVHATLGMEINADDLERTRGRYTIGAAFQIIEQLAFLVDVLGSSALVEDDFTVDGASAPGAIIPVRGLNFEGTGVSTVTPLAVERTDLIDLATGFKIAIPGNGVGYVGVIVPLNQDGVRAEAIPTAGLEFGF